MFEIIKYDYSNNNYDSWDIPFDYHCVYILENDKYAYIGETNDIIRRAKEHDKQSPKNKNKKYNFKYMHVIIGLLAEETPAKHYENLLIKLMRADKKFIIVNRSDGETQHYNRKNVFELHFDQLWIQLEKRELVMEKSFELIINSNTYKYSPNTILTEEQHNALSSIVNVINSKETKPHKKGFKTRPILICGDAGTGKTVVATSLFYYLKNDKQYENKKIALVYANPSTRSEIQEVFKNIDGLSKKDVISPVDVTKQHYDILICDEAQRLRRNKNLGNYYGFFRDGNKRLNFDNSHDELDWILKCSDSQILFYDKKQSTSPLDICHDQFKERLCDEKRGVRPVKLNEQMRIRAGGDYIPYICRVLYQKEDVMKSFNNYDFKLITSFRDMVKLIDEKDDEMGLCRICAGYAWKWKGKNDKTLVDITIDDIGIQWNKQTAGWLSNLAAKEEMGSIYTLPGLDLNYAGVVIGPELYYDKDDNKIKVNRNNFFDNKVKRGVTDDELRTYILNTYAVFLTRGIRGTYIYVCDNDLREYFKKFIALH